MATIYQRFGEKVKRLRKEKGLSQEQLAALIHRDSRTVIAIESGSRNPTLNTIHKIALAFKISLTDLFNF